MQKKFLVAAVVVCTGLVMMAYAFTTAPDRETAETKIPAAQVNTEHCNPSDCTPDKQATCPYSKQAQQSASATGECPATKECPPSKCNQGAEKATL